ncbi:MAG: LegC family aminotransferase [Holosporales bacterium]|jgi:aminotransferase in exopolysaccharide biosynthesis|nr:LegC family aminotransferase [Holosporales bacterium]
MSDFIPLSVPNLSGNELEYLIDAVKSGWISTSGGRISEFEEKLAQYLKVKKVAAIQSGTAGLHLAMILSDVGYGDEVIVPTLTFIAAVNPARYLGAEPIFMDCDDYLCLDIEKVADFCEKECDFKRGKLINKTTGKHIKVIVAVHVFGNIVDMYALMKLAQKYNLTVIEDATEALGSYNKETGDFAGAVGDFGVYSFNGNKIITAGGGGAVTAKSSALVDRAKYLSSQAKDDDVRFVHNETGYNYRMTNLQASIGLAQLEQIEEFIGIKEKNYALYKAAGLNLLGFQKNIRSNKWFYSLITDDRDGLIKRLQENNIQSRPIWTLIHTLRPYKQCQSYKIDKAIKYWGKVVNIPCSTNLTKDDIAYVASKIQ